MKLLRIRELREDKDKKQIEIAELLGIQQNSYSQIENGINTIQVDHLIRLASFYNTSTDYILGLTDEMKPYPKSNNMT
ncbi:MAG: helix-turn-helix transcriptional regulator [Clostridia bacterium]|nr:helix-turn-helix transcriptional regulator [Clostridia bacterium]